MESCDVVEDKEYQGTFKFINEADFRVKNQQTIRNKNVLKQTQNFENNNNNFYLEKQNKEGLLTEISSYENNKNTNIHQSINIHTFLRFSEYNTKLCSQFEQNYLDNSDDGNITKQNVIKSEQIYEKQNIKKINLERQKSEKKPLNKNDQSLNNSNDTSIKQNFKPMNKFFETAPSDFYHQVNNLQEQTSYKDIQSPNSNQKDELLNFSSSHRNNSSMRKDKKQQQTQVQTDCVTTTRKSTAHSQIFQLQYQTQTNLPALQNQNLDILSTERAQKKNEISKFQSPEPQDLYYIEKRYCQKCFQDQPIRTRHCNFCNQCIATYDHHCPWIGICIGEHNRMIFYLYLHVQLYLVIIAGIIISNDIIINFNNDIFKKPLFYFQIVGILIVLNFIFMLLALIFLHTYFLFYNLTTWEYFSWEKIQYIKELPQFVPVFSLGSKCQNIKFFFKQSFKFKNNEYKQWELNQNILQQCLNSKNINYKIKNKMKNNNKIKK